MKSIVTADKKAIVKAVELLKQGRLVAFPTETVYGLGADASNPDAVKQIFAAKGRPENHPLIVHIGSIEQLKDWALTIPDAAMQLANRFWPGPLAIILNKRPEVPLAVTGGQNTVALRMPNNPVALSLLKSFGGGIAAPSANRFKHISPTSANDVLEELGDAVDLILDGGSCSVGVESTIIDLSCSQPRLLRPGHITITELEDVLQVDVSSSNTSEIRSPGMMAVHYAPVTPARLCALQRLPDMLEKLSKMNKTVGLLVYKYQPAANHIHYIKMPEFEAEYAQSLYASLREMDRLKLDVILVEQPPQTEAWQAVNDRLGKATVLCE
ncbi:MAG: threonylcarbamoyl-AMP synthase [Methylococcales bacterium]|nr:threonylcarbamoyl-AMP synthase [Methylococcales bacterium]